MRLVMRWWGRLRWPERLASVLAFAWVITFALGGIVLAISATTVGYGLIVASFCLLIAASLVYLIFGPSGPNTMKWPRRLALAATLAFLALIVLAAFSAPPDFVSLAGLAVILLVNLAVLSYFLASAVRGIRILTGAGALAASLVAILFIISLFFLASFLVFLASNGDSAAFTVADPGYWSHRSWLGIFEIAAIDMVGLLIVVAPELAHLALPLRDTSELTKDRVTRWLTVSAAFFTGLYVFMFHFQKGPLAHFKPGTLTVVILFAIALLVPIYRSVITAFWKWGVLHIIDFGRWRADWQKVFKELRTARDRLEAELDARLDSAKTNSSKPQAVDEGASSSTPADTSTSHPSDRRDQVPTKITVQSGAKRHRMRRGGRRPERS